MKSAEAENLFLSVQRVLDYCELSSEAPLSTAEDNDITSDWPTVGSIDVKLLSVRYREGKPLSLKSLTFQVDGGTRVGVVGRCGYVYRSSLISSRNLPPRYLCSTGSGKSVSTCVKWKGFQTTDSFRAL